MQIVFSCPSESLYSFWVILKRVPSKAGAKEDNFSLWLNKNSILNFTSKQKKKNEIAQRGARTHDPEIKSLVLYRLS